MSIIRQFENCKTYSSFKGNILGADLADMQLINNCNEGIRFILCVTDIQIKYTWVPCLKDKKGIEITNAFQKILGESNFKANKMWVGKESKLYNRSIKSQLHGIDIEMYSAYDEGKSFVAERFIRMLNNQIYKYITSISKKYVN